MNNHEYTLSIINLLKSESRESVTISYRQAFLHKLKHEGLSYREIALAVRKSRNMVFNNVARFDNLLMSGDRICLETKAIIDELSIKITKINNIYQITINDINY